jgi:hypothetical protein
MKEETAPSLSLSVREAGKRYYDLGVKGSYAAARRGEIVTVRVGRLLRVPIAEQEAKVRELSRAGFAPRRRRIPQGPRHDH